MDRFTHSIRMRLCPRLLSSCRAYRDRLEAARPRLEPSDWTTWSEALSGLQAETELLAEAWSLGVAQPSILDQVLRQADRLFSGLRRLFTGLEGGVVAPTAPFPEQEEEKMESQDERMGSVPIGEHRLPPLPYAYDALEPHIDEQTMRLHHDKHHQSYVDGLNQAERKLAEARQTDDFDLVKHWEREAAFNGGGHYLHTIFWQTMSPEGGGEPDGLLAEAIAASFGSFDAFKRHFSKAAEKVEGSGWAILVWSPRSGRLEILQSEKHQNLSQWDVIPLLPLDVWEHAYYLKYQNNRSNYVDAWWNVVNWPAVARRFDMARQVRWAPY